MENTIDRTAVETQLMRDAICGVPIMGLPLDLRSHGEKSGLILSTGNQWNDNFEWNRDMIDSLPLETLIRIYQTLRP